jgi:hypothetical protein
MEEAALAHEKTSGHVSKAAKISIGQAQRNSASDLSTGKQRFRFSVI